MTNSISIWKDKIIFNWNGVMPDGYGPRDSVEIQDMPYLWPHLKGHCTYNKTMHKFLLFFSKQNLVRLRRQFGSLPILHGFERVTELKKKLDAFEAMRDLGLRIQNGEFADKVEIDYKMPPLAPYQHTGTVCLTLLNKVPLFADCGCLAGNSLIRYSRSNKNSVFQGVIPKSADTIENLYKLFNRHKKSSDFYVQSFSGSKIIKHKIVNVVQSGIKKVILLYLEDGKHLALTPDHEVMTDRGFVEAGKIKDQKVMVFNHMSDNGTYGNHYPEYSKVVSKTKIPKEVMTYDIVCEDPHRNFVANGMVVHNCGKTFMVLMSTDHQIKTGVLERGKTLICGKLATLETGWLDDTEKFTDLKANVLWAPPGKTRRNKILEKLNDPADIYIINHDGVKGFEEALAEKRFDKVVIDESTILKSFTGLHSRISGGVLGKSIMRVAEHATWRVIMSGTPAPNGADDLWGQINFLDPEGFLLEAGYRDFRHTYMHKIVFGKLAKDSDGNDIPGEPASRNTPTKWVLTDGKDKEINSLVGPHIFRVRIRDHIKDLPPKTVIRRSIPMTGEQQRVYDKVQKDLWLFFKKKKSDGTEEIGKISTDNVLTELIKLRQVTGGFLIADDKEAIPLKNNPKMDMMDQLLNDEIDHKEKVVIFAQYRWEIEMLKDRYKSYGVVTVYGGNSGSNNLKNLKTFMEDPKCRIIILHPRSAAHGITLTMAHYMIFYSVSYSAEDDYQSVARIERASQKNSMFVYYLLAKAKKGFSIDEIIYKVLVSKQRKQELLLDLRQSEVDSDIVGMWKKQFE